MRKRTAIITVLIVLCTTAEIYNLRANNMLEIRFELGQNIRETARISGAPKFVTRNVAGLLSYGLVDLPSDIPVHYARTGYAIKASPLFALTLYANEERRNGLAVEAAVLQYSSRAIKSHEAARTLVDELIAQFNKGKWKRYISEICPAVTGRSAFLNEAGEPEKIGTCPLDPHYRLSMSDWIRMMPMTQNYQWIGDGVLATIRIRFSDDIRGITYSIFLEFEDFSAKTLREEKNLARDLAEGDEKGWNSSARERDSSSARKTLIKILEENALKRGDRVVPRDS